MDGKHLYLLSCILYLVSAELARLYLVSQAFPDMVDLPGSRQDHLAIALDRKGFFLGGDKEGITLGKV